LYRYNAVNPKAKVFGLMNDENGQLRDVYTNGEWQNPYQLFTTLAISPSITSYNLTYGSVILPANLWLSNMGGEVSTIQFDAGDGQGYQTIVMNTASQFNYADTGWKHWTFRINLTNGQQLYTHTKVHINNISNFAGSGGPVLRGTDLDVQAITATKSFAGVFGKCRIVISYRNDNDRVIRKPLIVAEGLDLGHILNPEEPQGSNTYQEFIDRIDLSGSNNLKQLLFNGAISEYDIIYINWRNGSDYLQRNAYVLEEVIAWVNSHKQPLPGNSLPEKNVVLGYSMGGVLARMALGDMERTIGPNAHDTRLYISLDGPQQGSNFPLGLQAAARHALRMYLKTGMLATYTEVVALLPGLLSPLQALRSIDRPGAKQLLIQRIDENYNHDNITHEQFMLELRNQWQYPTNTRNIVISNGSECAIDQEFAAGGNLLYFERNIKTRFLGDLVLMVASPFIAAAAGPLAIPFVVPGSQDIHVKFVIRALANGGGNQVYYGKIKHTKKILWLLPVTITIAEKTYNAPTGLISYDTYPGSFFKLGLGNGVNAVFRDWMFNYDHTFMVQRRFTHVLTTSALDIGGGSVPLTNTQYFAKYVGENPPPPPYIIPFINFTAAYNQNPLILLGPINPNTGQPSYQITSTGSEEHTQLYLRNANFIAAELNANTTHRVNCSAYCDGGVSNWLSSICTSSPQSITIPGVSTGTTVQWSVSPTGIVSIAPNGASVSITPISSGTITLTATLTGDAVNVCGTKIFSKQIIVGVLEAPLIFGSNYDAQCGTFAEAYSTTPTGTTGHVWNLNYGQTIQDMNGNGSNYFYIAPFVNTPQQGQTYYNYLTVQVKNVCGLSDPSAIVSMTVGPVPNCNGGGGGPILLRISPNPAGSSANVEALENTYFIKLRILDKFGNLKKEWSYPPNSRRTLINLNNLPEGIYFLKSYDGTNWRTISFIKQ